MVYTRSYVIFMHKNESLNGLCFMSICIKFMQTLLFVKYNQTSGTCIDPIKGISSPVGMRKHATSHALC